MRRICPVGKRGGDTRMEGKQHDIGGGTVARSINRKKRLGATKKSPMYLHEQTMVVHTKLTTQHELSTHPLNKVCNKRKQKE